MDRLCVSPLGSFFVFRTLRVLFFIPLISLFNGGGLFPSVRTQQYRRGVGTGKNTQNGTAERVCISWEEWRVNLFVKKNVKENKKNVCVQKRNGGHPPNRHTTICVKASLPFLLYLKLFNVQ
jgi:hypothetical protein